MFVFKSAWNSKKGRDTCLLPGLAKPRFVEAIAKKHAIKTSLKLPEGVIHRCSVGGPGYSEKRSGGWQACQPSSYTALLRTTPKRASRFRVTRLLWNIYFPVGDDCGNK